MSKMGPRSAQSDQKFLRVPLADPHRVSAIRVAVGYLLVGLAWIVVTDLVLALVGGVTGYGLQASAMKGALFVLLSAGFVLWLCRREYRKTVHTMTLLRAVVEGTTDAVFVKSKDGRYLLLNPAGARFMGREIEEILGRDDREFFNAAEAARLMAKDQEIMAGGVVVTQEETLTSAGMTRVYQATKAPYFDSTGEVAGLIGISRDITDRSVVESALRETDARLREAQRIAGLGSWSWEPPTNRVWWSDAEFELFGVDSKTVRPSFEAFLGLLHPDDRTIAIERVKAMHAGADEFANELRVLRADGSTIWIHSQARATRDDDGVLVRVEGTDQDITDRKRAEVELLASERRLRLALESAGAIAFVWEIPSDSVTRYFSKEPALPVSSERIGTLAEVRSRVHPSDLAEFDRRLQKCLANGTEYSNEYRVVRSDGTFASLAEYGFIDRDANGSPIRLTGMSIDVSERLFATEALRMSEARYRQLVDMLPTAIFVYANDKILFGNPAFFRLMASSKQEELLGRNPYDLLHESSHDLFRRRQMEMVQRGEVWSGCEMLGLRLDGRLIPLHVVAAPVEGYGEMAILVAVSDLTERERSAALLRTVLDSVHDAILTVDDSGVITSVNRSTESLFGYSISELAGHDVLLLVPELPAEHWDRKSFASAPVIAGRPGSVGREVRGRRKNGTDFPAELTITEFLRDGQREFTWVLRDITARRQLEEQFRQAQKMEAVGRLAGGVAHDFNNLLTVINGYSEIILSGLSVNDPAQGPLAAIHDAGDRAARLTKQLLAFSRKSMVEPRLIDLNELVTESAKLFRRLIGENIVLSLVMNPMPVRVVLDPGQIEQVLMNLVVNARDAMPTGGRLTIETKIVNLGLEGDPAHPNLVPGRYASLRVSDTGSGISAEVRGKIFEPFFTTKGVGKGTGLGLAVVHGVVQQFGGSITADSIEGSGASFRILLPAADESVSEPTSKETNEVLQGRETLLVVEDEEAVRKLIRITMEGHGYTVLTATTGTEALDLIRSHEGPIDMLVTDMIMPGICGRELAEETRKFRPGLRVLYMSGYTDDALSRYCLQGTTDHFIQKPFAPLGIVRKIRGILDQA